MILTKQRFAQLWDALVERPGATGRSVVMDLENGVDEELATFLTECANGGTECLADLIPLD